MFSATVISHAGSAVGIAFLPAEVTALAFLGTIVSKPPKPLGEETAEDRRARRLYSWTMATIVASIAVALAGIPAGGGTAWQVAGGSALAFSAAVVLFVETGLRVRLLAGPWKQILSPRGRRRVVGLLGVAGLAFLAGALLDGSTAPTSTHLPTFGKYRVSGTCANGSCYVNQCPSPVRCGMHNRGTIAEGVRVDIACQVRGERIGAPNGKSSSIWDRLGSGLYVSDLFVDTPAVNRFTHGLPRCST